jgi:hypothetical protein
MALPNLDAVTELAGEALLLFSAGDVRAAGDMVNGIHAKHGDLAVVQAMVTWADILLTTDDGTPVLDDDDVSWMGTSGRMFEPGDIPAPIRWAGEFIKARHDNDTDGTFRLLQEMTNAPEGAGPYVSAVLSVVSTTIEAVADGKITENLKLVPIGRN